MKKNIYWFKNSNRYKMLIGAGANSLYCAAYAGIGVAIGFGVRMIIKLM